MGQNIKLSKDGYGLGRKNQIEEGLIKFGSDISSRVRMDMGGVEKNQIEEGWIKFGSDISS